MSNNEDVGMTYATGREMFTNLVTIKALFKAMNRLQCDERLGREHVRVALLVHDAVMDMTLPRIHPNEILEALSRRVILHPDAIYILAAGLASLYLLNDAPYEFKRDTCLPTDLAKTLLENDK